MRGSFHGRDARRITATAQEKFHVGFRPLPRIPVCSFNDVQGPGEGDRKKTCAIMVEPIQGESGVQMPSSDYSRGWRQICDDRGLLLILDEVQTGMGRTGKLSPTNISGSGRHHDLAKAWGTAILSGPSDNGSGGFGLRAGTHASTFGEIPWAWRRHCRPAGASGGRQSWATAGKWVLSGGEARDLQKKHFMIQEVGLGPHGGNGPHDRRPGRSFQRCLERGLLINCAGEHILRSSRP